MHILKVMRTAWLEDSLALLLTFSRVTRPALKGVITKAHAFNSVVLILIGVINTVLTRRRRQFCR
jgi:hypothetical protein